MTKKRFIFMAGAEKSLEITEKTPTTLETNKEQSPKKLSDEAKNKGGKPF